MILASIVSNAGAAAAAASHAHANSPGTGGSVGIGITFPLALAIPLLLLTLALLGLAWNRIFGDEYVDMNIPTLYTKCQKRGLFIDEADYIRIHGRFFRVFRIQIVSGNQRVMFENSHPERAYAEAHAWVDGFVGVVVENKA